ncbi:Vmc-like lipoprotein signal peptide domain-containing protein [Fluviicola sp.]|uniref:Vmc-like lipoprotein signal peptide domain-containing protein n=1 Tax=Fluviicola sp. TaxID=1917219 RepID=UPI003D28D6C1
MKNYNLMLASLLILVGVGAITVSCKKQVVKNRKTQVEVVTSKDGGEDDEDPIIQGRVKKKHSLSVIDDAYVETISYTTNEISQASYSDDNGEFEHQVPVDVYYFRVTVPGESTPFITDTVTINENSIVTILIDL